MKELFLKLKGILFDEGLSQIRPYADEVLFLSEQISCKGNVDSVRILNLGRQVKIA